MEPAPAAAETQAPKAKVPYDLPSIDSGQSLNQSLRSSPITRLFRSERRRESDECPHCQCEKEAGDLLNHKHEIDEHNSDEVSRPPRRAARRAP